jgi:hypothetical protein
MSHKY